MTPGWREQPTAGADRTRKLTGAATHSEAATSGLARAPAPNGWWAGPADDPDRYELLGAGLSGGEGTTYEARYHGESGMPMIVAVKQLHRPPGEAAAWPAPEDWARWRDQLHIIHQVRNDHLVQVRTIFPGAPPHRRGEQTEEAGAGTPYVVMDWITGMTLDQRLGSFAGSVDPRLRVAWIGHLASAISALHSVTRTAGNPLVHRDIKPGNCMVAADGRLVLIDIGTLRRVSAQPDPLGMHSRHYAAPEVLADLAAPRDPASDVYSLGGVAYFCLTGSDPPAASDITEDSIRSALAVPWSWRRRVARHLLPLLAAEPAVRRQVRLNTWAEQLRRISRRPRWPWLAAGTSAVLAALALVSYTPGGAAPAPGRTSPSPSITVSRASQPAPGGQPQEVDAMRAFGETHQHFGFSVRGNTLTIDPPVSFEYLWGGFLPAQDCTTTVSFDMEANPGPPLPDFGLAVAPLARLVDDEPEGASVQYEYEASDIASTPGTYIRPAALPGGAWAVDVKPVRAPDIDQPHHVVVYAEGQSMSIQVDGRQFADYMLPSAQCGGVAIRVWGDSFTLSNFSVLGS
jgi:serine/threonine protein kinase